MTRQQIMRINREDRMYYCTVDIGLECIIKSSFALKVHLLPNFTHNVMLELLQHLRRDIGVFGLLFVVYAGLQVNSRREIGTGPTQEVTYNLLHSPSLTLCSTCNTVYTAQKEAGLD